MNYSRLKKFIAQAINELSPQNIQNLYQMFLPHIMAAQSGISQTAMHGLQRTLARQGLSQSGVAPSRQLGLAGMLGNQAQMQAFQQAMGLAGQRANVFTSAMGQPAQQQNPSYMGNSFMQGVQQSLLAGALQQGSGGFQSPTYPQTPSTWGLPPTYQTGVIY